MLYEQSGPQSDFHLAAFFFTSIRRKVSSPFLSVQALASRLDNTRHTAAKSETTGYARAFRRAFDWQQMMSLALSGLISGASNISCSCSISSMNAFNIHASQYLTEGRRGQSSWHLRLWNSHLLRIGYSHSTMTDDERMQRSPV